nr:hypothetical protein [Tanacetum cinerariifolium]
MQNYYRLSNELREAVRMRDGYINELQISNNSNEVSDSIEIMRRMQFDDIEAASRLMLMAREIQTKHRALQMGETPSHISADINGFSYWTQWVTPINRRMWKNMFDSSRLRTPGKELVRSFNQQKNNIQAQQKKKMVKSSSSSKNKLCFSKDCKKNTEFLNRYSAVPPPPAQLYSPPKKDFSWTSLPEFKDDTVTDYSRPSPTIESSSDDAQNRNPSVTKNEASHSTISSKPFIKRTSKSSKVRGNQRNWNNLKSQQLESQDAREGVKSKNVTHKISQVYFATASAELMSCPAEEFALLVKIILSQRCINVSQRHINNSQQSSDSYARMVPAAAKDKE